MTKDLEIVTYNEACKILKVSRPSLLRLIKSGKLHACKVGHKWKIRKSELLKLIS